MIKLLERREYGDEFVKDISMGSTENVGHAIRKGMIPLEIKAAGDNVLEFIVSNGSVDRDHDTINVQGWDLTNYSKNPVVLWAHEHHSPPIGKGNNVRVENENLVADAEFVGADIMPFAKMIHDLYKGGFMQAVSVGFLPDERIWSEEQGGIKFLTQEMLEFSAVPVPANAEALQLGAKAGIDIAPMKSWAEQLLDDWKDGNRPVGASRKSIERMFKAAGSDPVISIPDKTIDPEKVKEIRQRNIWEPRLKEFRDGEWDDAWGKAEDVPEFLWEEHVQILEEKDLEAFSESEDLMEMAELYEGGLKALVKEAGRPFVQSILDGLVEADERATQLAQEVAAAESDVKEIDEIGAEDIQLVRDLLEAQGFKSMPDESIKEMIVDLEKELAEGKEVNDKMVTLQAELDQVVEERDLAMAFVEELVSESKESTQRVDPAEMVKMFGRTLASSIRSITGRLPDDLK
jgi:HK97 family phage prohead protease